MTEKHQQMKDLDRRVSVCDVLKAGLISRDAVETGDDDVDQVVRVGMVRLSVGMHEQVPTTDLTSVQDPFKDTNRLILPPLILKITNADEDEYTYPG